MKNAFKKPANARRNRKARQRYAKNKVAKPVAKTITKVIKAYERRNQETKYIVGYPTSLGGSSLNSFTGFSQAITSSNECYRLLPQIQIGDLSHQREGNVINPTSLSIRGRVVLDNRNPNSCGVFVHIYILTAKAAKSWEAAGATAQVIPTQRLLDNGDSTQRPFDGTYLTSMLKVNTQDFNVIKHDIIHLVKGADNYNLFATPTGGNSAFPYPTGQNGKNFSYTIPVPKKLHYSTAQGSGGTSVYSTQPNNFCPFMVVGWTGDDSYADSVTNNITMVTMEAQTHLYFTDPA